MRHHPFLKISDGFSLIEILVAFVIASSSLGLLYNIHANARTALMLSQEYSVASELASSLMNEYGVTAITVPNTWNGLYQNSFYWEVTLSPFSDTSNTTNTPTANTSVTVDSEQVLPLVQISVDISWQSRGKEQRFTMTSLAPASFNQLIAYNREF